MGKSFVTISTSDNVSTYGYSTIVFTGPNKGCEPTDWAFTPPEKFVVKSLLVPHWAESASDYYILNQSETVELCLNFWRDLVGGEEITFKVNSASGPPAFVTVTVPEPIISNEDIYMYP